MELRCAVRFHTAGFRIFPLNRGVPWNEFAVVTAKDIPGKNIVSLIVEDQPYLALETVKHLHEPILLLAHPNKYILEKARSLVKIDYEPLPGIFDIDSALGCRKCHQALSDGKGRCRFGVGARGAYL